MGKDSIPELRLNRKHTWFEFSLIAKQETEAFRIMREKSTEMFRRFDALGVQYSVYQDEILIDTPEDKVEAVQNVLRELWPSGVVGE